MENAKSTATVRMSKTEAEDFLTIEMRLLDDGKLEEWSQLFTSDAIYWFPKEAGAKRARENAIIYDDATQRDVRVRQIRLGGHLAQTPPSETVHFHSIVEVHPGDSDSEVIIRCNVLVYEMRPVATQGLDSTRGVPRAFPTRCEYRLRREETWKIVEKMVLLLQRGTPIYNLSFLI